MPESLPIRRNTALLAAALAANSAMLQLSAAVASLTLVLVLDVDGLLGLGPAIVLASGALAALPGRAGDGPHRPHAGARRRLLRRRGRLRARGGGQRARLGAGRAARARRRSAAASGTALLARTAAGDMYPPERRAHGIALVLFGAVFGAILGPPVFSPLLAGPRPRRRGARAPVARGRRRSCSSALALVLAVRPDPRQIAAELARAGARGDRTCPTRPRRRCASCSRRPGVIPALLAAQASFAVMVGVMTLTGAVVVDHHHHAAHHVFPIIGAHVVGMYALVIVVGDLIDRIGRTPSLAGGLLLMAASVDRACCGSTSVPATAGALFGLGVGLEPLVRRGDGGARRLHARRGSAASCWASTTCCPG